MNSAKAKLGFASKGRLVMMVGRARAVEREGVAGVRIVSKYMLCVGIAACFGLISPVSAGQTTSDDVSLQLKLLDTAIQEVSRKAEAAKQANASDSALLETLFIEVASLRADLEQLRDSMAAFQREVELSLMEENARLRDAVRLRYGDLERTLPKVPIPNRDLIEDALQPPRHAAMAATESPAHADAASRAKLQKLEYEVIREWGRPPEVAQRLGSDVPTLKGMVLAVKRGASAEQLTRLAEELHERFRAYDNINIEVFDDEAAARNFVETNTAEAGRRVLSISKFKEIGRDIAVLHKDGERITLDLPTG